MYDCITVECLNPINSESSLLKKELKRIFQGGGLNFLLDKLLKILFENNVIETDSLAFFLIYSLWVCLFAPFCFKKYFFFCLSVCICVSVFLSLPHSHSVSLSLWYLSKLRTIFWSLTHTNTLWFRKVSWWCYWQRFHCKNNNYFCDSWHEPDSLRIKNIFAGVAGQDLAGIVAGVAGQDQAGIVVWKGSWSKYCQHHQISSLTKKNYFNGWFGSRAVTMIGIRIRNTRF